MSDLIPQKILHIALESNISDLYPDDSYPMLYVVFWWYNVPLGHVEISRQQLPMSISKLRQIAVRTIAPAIEAHLQEYDLPVPQIEHFIGQPKFNADEVLDQWNKLFLVWREKRSMPAETTLSVVICTRDRPEYIRKCLMSLKSLSEPPDEILVVDNAPISEATQKVVAQIPGVRYILESRPGLDFARNAGIQHCTSEILAYTDDDVFVGSDWVQQLRHAFQDAEVMAVTGLVFAAELETQPQYIFEKYWSHNRGYCPINYDKSYFQKYKFIGAPAWRIGAGANMAFRRQLFDKVDGFDERLGAGAAGGSDDSEMWYRVLAEGFTCRYEPTAVTYHTHRREMESLKRQIFSYMRGHVAEFLIRFEKYHHWGNLVRLVSLPVFFGRTFLKSFLLPNGQLRRSTLGSECLGFLSGLKFYFDNRNYR